MSEPEPMAIAEEPEVVGEPQEILQGIVRCVFCKNQPTLTANDVIASKLMECCHTICGACIDSWPDNEKKKCPVCLLELNKSFLEHKILQEMIILPTLPAAETIMCDIHPSHVCEHYCVECEEYVCDVCIQSHNQLKVTQNHTIKHRNHCLPTTKEDKPFGQFPCPKHPIEQMGIYCITCNRLTCRDCQLGEHKDHIYKFVKHIVNDNRVKLLKMFLQTKYSWTIMERAVNILEDQKMDLHEQKMKIRKDIAELGSRLQKAVETGVTRLNRTLDTKCGKLMSHTERLVHSLLQNMAVFEHTSNFIEVILKRSTDTSLVYSQKFIRKHVETITSKKSIPCANPSSSEKLEFQHNIDHLIEALEKMGSITSKESTFPSFAQIREEVQKEVAKPDYEKTAVSNDEEGDKLFEQLVDKVKDAEANNTLQPQAEATNAQQAQIHVATNLMAPEAHQAQIHVATNLMDTDGRTVQQTDPKPTSWHTPQPSAGNQPSNETSAEQFAEVIQSLSINPEFVEHMLLQAEEAVEGNATVIQSAAPTSPHESLPPPPLLQPQATIHERNSLPPSYNSAIQSLPPVSTLAPFVQQSSAIFTPIAPSRAAVLAAQSDHMYSLNARQSLQLSSPQALMQQQPQISHLSPTHPINRVMQQGPNMRGLTVPQYTTQHSASPYGMDHTLNQLLRGPPNTPGCSSLFSSIDNHQ